MEKAAVLLEMLKGRGKGKKAAVPASCRRRAAGHAAAERALRGARACAQACRLRAEQVVPAAFGRLCGLLEQAYKSHAFLEDQLTQLQSERECAICFDEDIPLEQLSVLGGCSHVFHTACATDWLRHNRTCPHCRQPARLADLRSVAAELAPASPVLFPRTSFVGCCF